MTEDNVQSTETTAVAVKKQNDAIFEQANLNPKYTFDTFVVGNNNTFAHAASLAVAESPGNRLQSAVYLRRRRTWEDPSDAFDRAFHFGK